MLQAELGEGCLHSSRSIGCSVDTSMLRWRQRWQQAQARSAGQPWIQWFAQGLQQMLSNERSEQVAAGDAPHKTPTWPAALQ